MFWGLIIESNKKYTQVVEKNFHLSMASLDVNKSSNENVQVNVFYEKNSYLLCTLNKTSVFQQALDLNFEIGKKISFSCNGNGRVYLTGYIIEEEDDDMFADESNEEEEEVPELVPMEKKRKIKQNDKQNNAKKLKMDEPLPDDTDSDDEDFTARDGMKEDGDAESSDDEDDDEEDDDEDEDDDDDDEEGDEDDESEDEDEKEVKEEPKKKPVKNEVVSNGVTTKAASKQKKQKNKKENNKTEDKSEQQKQQQQKKVVEGGVQIEEIRQGNGAPAKPGKFVNVYYVGRLKTGKKFDQTLNGEGFKFRLGKGEVIKGWDVGIVGMKVGGKRRITIPPNMGYGAKGSLPVIPPNSQLIFEVELKSVN